MMKRLKIGAAQSISVRGDVRENIKRHQKLIGLANKNNAGIILFPELSLTGYEPDLADSLAFSIDDRRLDPLKESSASKQIIVIAGAPVRMETGLHIGSFIIFPEGSVLLYTKKYLHPSENKYFSPGILCPVLNIDKETISLAICADTANPEHAKKASEAGSTVYLVSILTSKRGYKADTDLLKGYAAKYSMLVVMANHGAKSGEYDSAGCSAVWSNKGDIIAALDGPGEGMVIVEKAKRSWEGKTIKLS
jgi:predicted amidohydrolase